MDRRTCRFRVGGSAGGRRRTCNVSTDAQQSQRTGNDYDQCVAVHCIAAGQNRSHDRRTEERSAQETPHMTQYRASPFLGPRVCHSRCRVHRDAACGCSTRPRSRNVHGARGRQKHRARILQAASARTGTDAPEAITRTTSSAWALADVTAFRTASSPIATPSMRMTSTSVMPIRPSTVRK